jgi:hypothetical protein
MEGESPPPARNRTAAVAIIVAAVALGAFVLVGIGVLLGWIPRGAPPDASSVAPGPGAPASNAGNGLQKFEGNEPLMPRYSQPHAPPPAPVQDFATATPPAPHAMPAAAPVPQPPAPLASPPRGRFDSEDPSGPAPPSFGRAEPRAAPAPPAQSRGPCEECGRIMGIANWRSGWEVRVRFDDGSTQTYHFRRRPPFELGERVRLDGDVLIAD